MFIYAVSSTMSTITINKHTGLGLYGMVDSPNGDIAEAEPCRDYQDLARKYLAHDSTDVKLCIVDGLWKPMYKNSLGWHTCRPEWKFPLDQYPKEQEFYLAFGTMLAEELLIDTPLTALQELRSLVAPLIEGYPDEGVVESLFDQLESLLKLI